MSKNWVKGKWFVSPYNYLPEIWKDFNPSERFELHDITLRDGEETSGVVFDKYDKLKIAEALNELGIKRIELGLFISPDDPEALEAVAEAGLEADIYTIFRFNKKEGIDIALKCDVKNITLSAPSSEVLIKYDYKLTREDVINRTIENMDYAKDHGLHVNLFLIDTFRTEWDQLINFIKKGEEGGAEAIILVDTFGVASPPAVFYLVKRVKEEVSIPVELHVHNDYGLATANALSGYVAGVDAVHVSVNGLGLRCGNPALEEVALSLKTLYGLDLKINYEKLYEVCKLVEEISGIELSKNKPIVGDYAFAREPFRVIKRLEDAGIPEAAFPFHPSIVGQKSEVILAKWSDETAVKVKLKELGLSISEDRIPKILERIKKLSLAKKSYVTDKEFMEMIEEATRMD